MTTELTPEQLQTIREHGQDFKQWLQTDNGKENLLAHEEHRKYFQQKLSSENIDKISEKEFAEIWKNCWASMMWGNKGWYVQNKLIDTLIRSDDFVVRYDKFRQTLQGFGVAIISELLNMIFPDKFCLWNETPRSVLSFLKLNSLPTKVFKYRTLTGEEYRQCLDYLSQIKNELSEYGVKDFIDLDIFFWHISEDIIPKSAKASPATKSDIRKIDATELNELIAAYDKDRNYFGTRKISEKEVMENQSKFIHDFPPEQILNLDLDRYVFGKIDPIKGQVDKTTFCYRLEFGLPGFGGISGTPATKFGMYCDRKTQEYKYDEERYGSVEDAFGAIKSEINSIIQAGKELIVDSDWKKLSNVLEGDFNIQRHVRSKILAIYFPNEFLSMHGNKQAGEILGSVFGIDPAKIENIILPNQ